MEILSEEEKFDGIIGIVSHVETSQGYCQPRKIVIELSVLVSSIHLHVHMYQVRSSFQKSGNKQLC